MVYSVLDNRCGVQGSAVVMVCTKVRLNPALISVFRRVDKSKHAHSNRITQSSNKMYEDASESLWFSKY